MCCSVFFFSADDFTAIHIWKCYINTSLRGGFKHFLFSPLHGEMIQFDEHIFQMGSNHQLDHRLVLRIVHSIYVLYRIYLLCGRGTSGFRLQNSSRESVKAEPPGLLESLDEGSCLLLMVKRSGVKTS